MRPKPICAICKHRINLKAQELTLNCIQDKAVYSVLVAKDKENKMRVHSACAQTPHKHGWMEVGAADIKHNDDNMVCAMLCDSHYNTWMLLY